MITAASLYLSISLSVALLIWGFFANGFTTQALGLVIFGIAWIIGQIRWVWIASLGLAVVTLGAVLGIFYNLPVALMAGGVLFALIAWDLAEFHFRLKKAAKEDAIGTLERRHFTRLGLIIGLGCAIILFTRFLRVRFNFEVAALLILAGVWGISLLVGRLRRSE
jgi:hypothetical protein